MEREEYHDCWRMQQTKLCGENNMIEDGGHLFAQTGQPLLRLIFPLIQPPT